MALYIIGYIISYLSGGIFELKKCRLKYATLVLFLLCTILALFAGFRDFKWPDTHVYVHVFNYELTPIGDSSVNNDSLPYSEPFFIYIARVIKTFTTSGRIYILLISIFTISLLDKALKMYCVCPIIGLCVYLSRFYISRNLMQIRAALALAIILFAIKYVQDRNFRRFILVVLIATLIHYSAIIAVPLYWLNKRIIGNKGLFWLIIICFIIIIFLSTLTSSIIVQINAMIGLNNTYVGGYDNYSNGLGLTNPMIYYQIGILYLWSIMPYQQLNIKYYHIIRNAYIYSTVVLILFSPFLVLGARLSTVFATLEIFIIPSLIKYQNSVESKYIYYMGFGILLTLLFIMNLNKAKDFI